MSNNYFQFKQFTITQDKCAMKVSTDACIQGAWTPVLPGVKKVLDIGTGTGLLSLMLAQKNIEITIDAIELDSDAAQQAKQNVLSSLWKERIAIIEGNVRNSTFAKKYDLIICNPPFFQNSLLGDEAKRNMAKHTLTLTHASLFGVIDNLLEDDGYVSVLLPTDEFAKWELLLAEKKWHVFNKLLVKHRKDESVKRIVGLCRRFPIKEKTEQTLIIRKNEHEYSAEFIDLLRPYYLNL